MRGAIYRNAKGKIWQIQASGLELQETPPRTRVFDDYDGLFAEASRRIRTRKKAGYELICNSLALERGQQSSVSDTHLQTIKTQFGPRRSIWSDAYKELAEILSDPESYEGGILLIDGDLELDNHWDIRNYAAVVVLGNCSVDGVVYQYETEPWLIVTGNLNVRALVMAGNLDVGGDLVAKECAEFESGDGYAHIGGALQANTTLIWDMPVTCHRLDCETLVSGHSTDASPPAPVVCKEHRVGTVIGRVLCGPQMLHFSECALDFNGLTGAEREAELATGSAPELELKQRELIHLLGLPLIR